MESPQPYPARRRRVKVSVPNVASHTRGQTARGQVFTLLLLSFLISSLANSTTQATGKSKTGDFFKAINSKTLPAWAVVFVMLTLLSDFDESAQFAVGLTWLIFLGILLIKGPDALAKITYYTGQPLEPADQNTIPTPDELKGRTK